MGPKSFTCPIFGSRRCVGSVRRMGWLEGTCADVARLRSRKLGVTFPLAWKRGNPTGDPRRPPRRGYAEWQARDVDAHDTFGAVSPTVSVALVVKSRNSVRSPTCEVRIDDHHRRMRVLATKGRARRRVQCGAYLGPSAISRPPTKLRPHSRPGAELVRQVAPLVPGVGDVKHPVDDIAQVVSMFWSSFGGNEQQGFEGLQLGVGQFT